MAPHYYDIQYQVAAKTIKRELLYTFLKLSEQIGYQVYTIHYAHLSIVLQTLTNTQQSAQRIGHRVRKLHSRKAHGQKAITTSPFNKPLKAC
jgi:hypothetical protein